MGQRVSLRVPTRLAGRLHVAAAPFFLPSTEMVHGRRGRPTSHYWYISPGLRHYTYVDPTRKNVDGTPVTLIEQRSTGHQTVVPPSTHENGEPIEWERAGEPAHVEEAVLDRAARQIAATAMLAYRWPAGARHDAALALGGLLRHGEIELHDAERMIEVVSRVAGDPEWHDRVRAVRDTYAKTGPTTGGKRLADLVPDGPAVVLKLRE
jgi:putative DNA primase/helicase